MENMLMLPQFDVTQYAMESMTAEKIQQKKLYTLKYKITLIKISSCLPIWYFSWNLWSTKRNLRSFLQNIQGKDWPMCVHLCSMPKLIQ